MGILVNKRGAEDTSLFESVIFIVLNVAFFAIMLVFVFKASSGALIYEQTYAKQIALLVDQAKPKMTVILDVGEGVEIARGNNMDISKIFSVDDESKGVSVRLSNSGGYNITYFSDYDVRLDYKGGDVLTIFIDEKNE